MPPLSRKPSCRRNTDPAPHSCSSAPPASLPDSAPCPLRRTPPHHRHEDPLLRNRRYMHRPLLPTLQPLSTCDRNADRRTYCRLRSSNPARRSETLCLTQKPVPNRSALTVLYNSTSCQSGFRRLRALQTSADREAY